MANKGLNLYNPIKFTFTETYQNKEQTKELVCEVNPTIVKKVLTQKEKQDQIDLKKSMINKFNLLCKQNPFEKNGQTSNFIKHQRSIIKSKNLIAQKDELEKKLIPEQIPKQIPNGEQKVVNIIQDDETILPEQLLKITSEKLGVIQPKAWTYEKVNQHMQKAVQEQNKLVFSEAAKEKDQYDRDYDKGKVKKVKKKRRIQKLDFNTAQKKKNKWVNQY